MLCCDTLLCVLSSCTALYCTALSSCKIQYSTVTRYHDLRYDPSLLLIFISLPTPFLTFPIPLSPTSPCVQSVLLQTKLEEVTWHISETTFEFCASHAEVDMMKSKGGKSHPSSRRSQVRTNIISQTFQMNLDLIILDASILYRSSLLCTEFR